MAKVSDERVTEWRAFLKGAEELEGNPAWVGFVRRLGELARLHAEAHEDERLPAEKRAEHLHAMKVTRELLGWVDGEVEKGRKAIGRYYGKGGKGKDSLASEAADG